MFAEGGDYFYYYGGVIEALKGDGELIFLRIDIGSMA